jgi:4-aminobutyrate aminotransferase-like enzyme
MSALRFSRNTLPRRPFEFSHGEGARFWDVAGREVVDLSSQTLNLLFGQVHPRITGAVVDTVQRATFVTQDFLNPLQVEAMEALARLIPPHLTALNMRMNDGSSAVESAVKQVRRATGKPRVLTTEGIYLGQNSQVIHLRGFGKRPMDLLVGSTEDVVFAPLPFRWDLAGTDAPLDPVESGELMAGLVAEHAEDLACVLVDPILISCGVVGGREGSMRIFAARVAEACRKHGVPLVFDESQTLGWIDGDTFAGRWGIDVDLLVLAKGIAGGYPVAVCASRPQFDNLEFCEADYTHGGHPVGLAALKATCELIAEEADVLRALSRVLDEVLEEEVGRRAPRVLTRGVDLIRGIDLRYFPETERNAALSRAVSFRCLEEGVYIRNYGQMLVVKLPRVIDEQTLRGALRKVFTILDEMVAV